MEQPRSQTTGRFVKDAGAGAGASAGAASAQKWIEKVKAHWMATKAKNPSYTYKQALISMKGH